jgi:hypothetical protein
MVITQRIRRASWRARAEQFGAALAVLAAGYVSLGTGCIASSVTRTAEREVTFLEGEQTHLVQIRAAPAWWERITLTSSLPLGFTPAEGDTVAQDGGVSVDASSGEDGRAGISLSCNRRDGCSIMTISVQRTSQTGAFTALLAANLVVMGGCEGDPPEVVEVRLDVIQ